MYYILWVGTMRPKARGLAQNGGPPDRRRVTRQVWFCTWWTGRTAYLFRTVPVALTGAAHLWADGIFQQLLNSKCTQPSVISYTSRKKSMAWYSPRSMPSLWGTMKTPLPVSPTYTDRHRLAGGGIGEGVWAGDGERQVDETFCGQIISKIESCVRPLRWTTVLSLTFCLVIGWNVWCNCNVNKTKNMYQCSNWPKKFY